MVFSDHRPPKKRLSLILPYIPGSVAAEPATVFLMCVGVEADSHHIAHLDVELSNLVLAEQVKQQPLGVSVIGLQHILLALPFSLGRPSRFHREDSDDFSLYFHYRD